MEITEKIRNIIFPQGIYCICCGKYIDDTRTYCLCDHCISHMDFKLRNLNVATESQKVFDYAVAAMGYGVYERRLIFNLKYDGQTYIARIISHILYDCMRQTLAETGECPWLKADVIVPVPVHKIRMAERGFNQTEKISKHFAGLCGIQVVEDGLVRIKHTEAQRALSAYERQENMRDAFKVNDNKIEKIRDKKILLIDDIYTTGATAQECGNALRKAGAKELYFLSLLAAGSKKHKFYT